jgi:hypothetical protein
MKFLLNSYRLSHYLIGVSKNHIIPTAVTSFDDNEQHRIFTAEWPDKKIWFVKQPYNLAADEGFGVLNESEAMKIISNIDSLLHYTPGLIFYDPIHKILITDYLIGYENLSKTIDTIAPNLAENKLFDKLGNMMGSFHTHLTSSVKIYPSNWKFSSVKPSILPHSISKFRALIYNERIDYSVRKSFESRLLKAEVFKTILSLNDSWQSTSLIHGDANFYNMLIVMNHKTVAKTVLCDWQFAGWGDPDWDTSCIFQGLLNTYIKMHINYSMLINAGEEYYESYKKANLTAQLLPFEFWLKKILQLAALGLLERLVEQNAKNTAFQTTNPEISGEKMEFLITVLLDPLNRTS